MFSWHAIPFARLLVPFIIGILIHTFYPESVWPAAFLMITCILFILAYPFLFKLKKGYTHRTVWGIVFTISVILSGLLVSFLNEPAVYNSHYSKINYADRLIVCINDEVSEKPKSFNAFASVEAVVKKDGRLTECSGQVFIRFSKFQFPQKPQNGSRYLLHSDLHLVSGPDNPDQFDYQTYLKRRQVIHILYADSSNSKTLNPHSFSLYRTASGYRATCLEVMRKYIPDSKSLGVAEALLLGYKDDLDPDVSEGFTRTGTLHVLAVSGLHAGLIYMILGFLTGFLKKFRRGLFIQTLIILGGLWLYCFMTGLSSSVVRAGVMFSIVSIAQLINRKQNIYNTIYASAFLMLVYNPNYFFEAGFQLSYAAVLGIVLLYPRLNALYIPKNKILKFIYNTSCVTLAAQAFTLPISLYYFNQFPTYFLLTNIVIIPLFTAILVLLVILMPLSVFAGAASLLGIFIHQLIHFNQLFMNWTELWPYPTIEGLYISLGSTILLYLIVCFGIATVMHKKKWQLFVTLGLCLTLVTVNSYRLFNQNNQKLIAFHVFRGHDVVTCIDNHQAFVISDVEFLQKNNLKFNLGKFLNRLGVSKIIPVANDQIFNSAHLKHVPKIGFQFFDRTMTIKISDHLNIQSRGFYLIKGFEKNLNDILHKGDKNLIISNKIKKKRLREIEKHYFKQYGREINLSPKFQLIDLNHS